MMKAGVQAIGIAVREAEPGADAKAGFAIQQIRIQRSLHDGVHGFPNQIEGVWLQLSMQDAHVLILAWFKPLIRRGAARPSDQRRLKDGDIALRVVRAIYQLMFLLREKPQQRPRVKGIASPIHDVGDGPAHHQVQLQLNVVMALQSGRVSRGFDQIEEAIVSPTEFQVFEHTDKIR